VGGAVGPFFGADLSKVKLVTSYHNTSLPWVTIMLQDCNRRYGVPGCLQQKKTDGGGVPSVSSVPTSKVKLGISYHIIARASVNKALQECNALQHKSLPPAATWRSAYG
jgi:hypothetical protein